MSTAERLAATGARRAGTVEPGPARTLAEDLRRRDDDALAALFRRRPDLLSPVPRDVTDLVARAAARFSITRVLDGLDRFTLQVLDALGHLPDPTDLAEVRRLVPTDPDRIATAVATLRDAALLWGSDEALHLVRGAREALGPGPGGTGPPLANAAAGYPPGRLQHLLLDLGLTATPDPVTAVAALRARLGDPAGLAQVLADAPGEARELLAKVDTAAGGQVDRADRSVRSDEAFTPLEWLLSRGVLIALDADTVVLPAEVAVALRGGALYPQPAIAPPAARRSDVGAAKAERVAVGQVLACVQHVEAVLEAWTADPAAALRGGGGLGVRDLKRVQLITNLSPGEAALIVEVAYVAGLVSADGTAGEVWLPTTAYDRWLLTDPAARWVELADAWLSTSRVPALVGTRTGTGSGKDRPFAALGAELDRAWAASARRAGLAELAALRAGQAIELTDVLARLTWRAPRRSGATQDLLVRATLAEAAQLGLTGLGALTSWSRALLDNDPDACSAKLRKALPEPLDQVLVQADLTAVAPGPLTRALALELAGVADVESTGAATVYRFTADSVRRALDAGRSAAEVHALLERASRTPIPQPLSYLVDDVARRHGRIRVGSAKAYLRCDDESVVTELLAARGTERLRLRRLAPTVLTAGVGPEELLSGLRELGYAPAAESASGALVVGRPAARRSKPARIPQPVWMHREPGEALLAAAVRALRAGDRAGALGRRAGIGDAQGVPISADLRTSPAISMERLRTAAATGNSVLLGYVGDDGTAGEAIVDPLTLDSGVLRAFDHRHNRIRDFKLSRIRVVAEA